MSARNRDGGLITIFVALVISVFVLAAVVACNPGGGDSYYYPQDHSHGYYDVHHHYHYYPKYDRRSKVYVAPRKGAPGVRVKPGTRSGGGSVFKGGSGGFKKSGGSGFRSSRR